jgi:hypothetical protein
MGPAQLPATQVEILAYAPTEFYHCQHCEAVWHHLGVGQGIHAEQRASALPPDLQAEYAAIVDWVSGALERYGQRVSFRVVDAASAEGVWKSLRHRVRLFPAFIVDGERIAGFDRPRLDAALAARIDAAQAPRP